MIGLEAGTNFSRVCFDPTLRQPTGWDFLVCEGHSGWAAIHITSSLLFYVFFQRAWLVIGLHGLWESFEVLLLSLFGNYVVYATGVATIETHASSALGDLLISGTLGVVLGILAVAYWRIPVLICPPPPAPLEGEEEEEDYSHNVPPPATRLRHISTAIGYALWLLLITLSTGFTSWIHPYPACLSALPYSCENRGLVVTTLLEGLGLLALRLPCLPIRLTWRQVCGVWLVILIVHAQSFQPWVPLYLGATGGFTQPWLAAALLCLLLLLLLAYRRPTVVQGWTRVVGLYVGGFFLLLVYVGSWVTTSLSRPCRCCARRRMPTPLLSPITSATSHFFSAQARQGQTRWDGRRYQQ